MKVQTRVALGSQYAKKGEDIKDGDIIKILDSGQMVPGKFGGENLTIQISTRNGDRSLSLNQTSVNNLIQLYGDETEKWIGGTAKVFMIRALVSGKMSNVTYLAGNDWEMNDDGKFVKQMSQNQSFDDEIPTIHIEEDDGEPHNVADVDF